METVGTALQVNIFPSAMHFPPSIMGRQGETHASPAPNDPKRHKKMRRSPSSDDSGAFFIKPIDIQRVYTSVIPKIYNESSTYLMRWRRHV